MKKKKHPALKHRSHVPPPGFAHKDKRKKTRSQEKRDVYKKFNELNEWW